MSSAKRDTNLATAGLAAAAVLVFGATAAFAATSGGPGAKSRTTEQFAHNSAAYGAGPETGGVAGEETGTLPDSGAFGQGPHGDETTKDATGQWVQQIWQTGKVDSVSGNQVKVTDVTGLAWQWTVSSTAKVLINGAPGQVEAIEAGDTVTLSGTETGKAHTATTVTDPGHTRG